MQTLPAPYDLVGQYNQDQINGFDDTLLLRLLESSRLKGGQQILDAMAGDGNLSTKIYQYHQAHELLLPQVTVLEFSKVQCEIARQSLSQYPVQVVWGDILKMQSLADEHVLPAGIFDRVLIKSANHEIPLRCQEQLYHNIYNALQADGLFINLGFLFDDEKERDELREIARTKDRLAGLEMAVQNRHFLTRNEFYDRLRKVGFVDIEAAHAFTYQIRSEIVAQRYFKTEVVERDDLEFQISQLRAKTMRRKGRMRFEADASIMECPGEITVARRPSRQEENQAIYKRYPYDFLRHIKAHRELLASAASFIRPHSAVLDAGCGIGLLAEKVATATSRYLAVDSNPEFIEICQTRLRSQPQVEVLLGDLNNLRLDAEAFDCALALNVIYQEGIKPERVLPMLRDTLRRGGTLVLSGPNNAHSFEQCEQKIISDLDSEGVLSGKEEIIQSIRAANAKLLSSNGHYWSAHEIANLLMELDFSKIVRLETKLYYGTAWLVAAQR